jgi:hypothetical protein
MAFAVSDDHARQEQVLEQISHYNSDPGDIRCALTDDEIAASNRLVRFVTLKAYEKAGGMVRRDLFADDEDGIFILDRVLLDQLVTKNWKNPPRTSPGKAGNGSKSARHSTAANGTAANAATPSLCRFRLKSGRNSIGSTRNTNRSATPRTN